MLASAQNGWQSDSDSGRRDSIRYEVGCPQWEVPAGAERRIRDRVPDRRPAYVRRGDRIRGCQDLLQNLSRRGSPRRMVSTESAQAHRRSLLSLARGDGRASPPRSRFREGDDRLNATRTICTGGQDLYSVQPRSAQRTDGSREIQDTHQILLLSLILLPLPLSSQPPCLPLSM
ncbi:hypothetical protein BCV69DRAFT_111034 [Microstroma glucosiphilum]|uniref:Uncharacterized protein n=1 Tax=Pseudomicrostroma glucosiphilum TaxID=1684307 RepID=A0A316UD75_9BASI|nr:hypothetical protein BCV69DRAFT_111034 [Pseudomicrostroma glucosiphilum]PWN23170.1 hypothetical protein BCV69DRAFT_111034 [Pseudomicrostroma glucosiphilum]